MMRTLVATRGGGDGAGRSVQPQTSVTAARVSTVIQSAIRDQGFMKWFYCLCCQESGIVARRKSRKGGWHFCRKSASHLLSWSFLSGPTTVVFSLGYPVISPKRRLAPLPGECQPPFKRSRL